MGERGIRDKTFTSYVIYFTFLNLHNIWRDGLILTKLAAKQQECEIEEDACSWFYCKRLLFVISLLIRFGTKYEDHAFKNTLSRTLHFFIHRKITHLNYFPSVFIISNTHKVRKANLPYHTFLILNPIAANFSANRWNNRYLGVPEMNIPHA